MENIGNQLLTKAMEYLQSAEAFAKSEVPLYLQELIKFKVVEHLVEYLDNLVVFIILTTIAAVLLKKVLKMSEETRDDRDFKMFMTALAAIFMVVSAIGTLVSVANTENLVKAYKAYAAPRVYLIDYVKEALVNKPEVK